MRRLGFHRLAAGLLAAVLLLASPPGFAQNSAAPAEDGIDSIDASRMTSPVDRLLADDLPADDFTAAGGLETASQDEIEAYAQATIAALTSGRTVRARELAERLYRAAPTAPESLVVLGIVHHQVEGNLPRALWYLRRGLDTIVERWGDQPPDDGPWIWHALTLAELASVHGEMGEHREKLRFLDERERLYRPHYPAERGWPLMRLGRYEEARRAIAAGIASEDPDQRASALTALCAVEAEQQHRQRGYDACLAAAEFEEETQEGPTALTNVAEASLGLLRLDEAERHLLAATARPAIGTVSNPWLDLAQLYIATGRMGEAVDAVRRMAAWHDRQPSALGQQTRAEGDTTRALFLLVAGHPREAMVPARRAFERPDRTGFTSSDSEQLEAGVAVIDSVVHRTAAALVAEAAAAAPWSERPRLWIEQLRLRLRAATSARRAAALVADERRLVATLRPYLAGSVELPEWIALELGSMVGDGIVSAALETAREREDLPEATGHLLAWETELAALDRHHARTLDLAERALAALPSSEVLLRARVAARGAHAAQKAGRTPRAAALWDLVFQLDPGTVRRLELSLPTHIEAAAGAFAASAGAALEASPRFHGAREAPFTIQIGDGQAGSACLVGPGGTRLACAEASDPTRAAPPEERGRSLAVELQRAAFAPRLDLAQSDLRTLDGSPTAAGSTGPVLLDELAPIR